MNSFDLEFYRVDELDNQFNVVRVRAVLEKVNTKASDEVDILYEIPKDIKQSYEVAKRLCHSLVKGDFGHINIGFKFESENGVEYKNEKSMHINEVSGYLKNVFSGNIKEDNSEINLN